MSDRVYLARQFRRAMQHAISDVADESTMMQFSDVYPTFAELVSYGSVCKAGTICSYGLNADNETQLYSFISDLTPDANYPPDVSISQYKKIGFSGGIPIWTQPYGATDAYQVGDVVTHNSKTWENATPNNVWEPGVYGWNEVTV